MATKAYFWHGGSHIHIMSISLKSQLFNSVNRFSPTRIVIWVLRLKEEEDEEQSLMLGQPVVCSVSDFIFLASAYEGGWQVLSLTVSSSHWQCSVSVLVIAEFARGGGGAEVSNQISALVGIWTLNLTIGSPARKPLDHHAPLKQRLNDYAICFYSFWWWRRIGGMRARVLASANGRSLTTVTARRLTCGSIERTAATSITTANRVSLCRALRSRITLRVSLTSTARLFPLAKMER